MNRPFNFQPRSAEFARDPYSVYARMRRECPVYYHEDWDAWLFSTCEDIKNLVVDERLGRTLDHVLSPGEVAALPQKTRVGRGAQPQPLREGLDH